MMFPRYSVYVGLLLTLLALAATAFKNPLKTSNGSDPHMVYWNGYYYLTTTTWSNIQILRATSIAGLKTATPQTVWTDSTSGRCCNMWAPEMHRIDGRWYIYYTAGPSGSTYDTTQKTWVIQGGTDNPLQSYTFLSQMIAPNNNIATLDSSITQINSVNYYLYSAWGSGGQSIWISRLLTPGTIGPSTKISTPQYTWEKATYGVNEGPAGLTSPSGRSYIFFSASYCGTSSYALGYLTLTAGADPLVASSWTKNPNAVFSSGNGNYGPGHNGFFKSPSGNDTYNVYHANASPSGVCDGNRSTRVQKVNWNSDGTPNLGTPENVSTEIAEPV
ncbi:Arabinanase/levansucrase/invertase [Geopyxis carbonaria]|nr:Arabinanase/levansucrase/invertase [Geopyxis carbonaria]